MTPGLLALAMVGGVLVVALVGPWFLRQAAPALVRVPRLAIAVVGGGVVAWLGALLAIGPALAWAGPGGVVLPAGAADVCQRCLAAANPFPEAGAGTVVPTLLLLALPAVVAVVLGAGVARQMHGRGRRSRAAAQSLLHGARRRELYGYEVSVVDAAHPFALTFPARHGGIALSTGAVETLDDAELAAVLAHEHAHLHQRHHLVAGVVASLATFLRWVPFVDAVAGALPHYLEIAADDQARRHAGTPALVSALVKLGERTHHAMPAAAHGEALHAAGPERIHQLVRPSAGLAGTAPAAMFAGAFVAMAVVAATVHLPYAWAALTGCV